MRKAMWIGAAMVLFAAAAGAGQAQGPSYTFDLPEDVKFELADEKAQLHLFRWGDETHNAVFMLYPQAAGWPASDEMVESLVQTMVSGFEKQLDKHEELEIVSKSKDKVALGPFSGTRIKFVLHTEAADQEVHQHMLVLADEARHMWFGQLSATSEGDYATVEKILKSAEPVETAEPEAAPAPEAMPED